MHALIGRARDLLAAHHTVRLRAPGAGLTGLAAQALHDRLKRPLTVVYASDGCEEPGGAVSALAFFLHDHEALFSYRRAVEAFTEAGVDRGVDLLLLSQLLGTVNRRQRVVVAPAWSLLARFPGRPAPVLTLQAGGTLDRDALVRMIEERGYERSILTEAPGEYSVRGGIVDLYPAARRLPVRIEFDGDLLDSVREFQPSNQASLRPVEQPVFVPFIVAGGPEADADRPTRGVAELFPPDTLHLLLDGVAVQADLERYHARLPVDARDRLPADPAGLLAGRRVVEFNPLDPTDRECLDLGPLSDEAAGWNMPPGLSPPSEAYLDRLFGNVRELLDRGYAVMMTAAAPRELERLELLLDNRGLPHRRSELSPGMIAAARADHVHLIQARLEDGFVLHDPGLALFTERDVLGRVVVHRETAWEPEGDPLESADGLEPGDYVVHVDFGIGRYEGLRHLTIDGLSGDFLDIVYRDGGRLLLPAHRLEKVYRYSSPEGAPPLLDRMGGEAWVRRRENAKLDARRIASELLRLYAERERSLGIAYPPVDELYARFENEFPFVETPDQLRACDEVAADMSKGSPMERLVCGDVGFGKTEVAIRAAFRAALDSRQTAVLVPTTILALQHHESFSRRLKGYPLRVEHLSRFRSPAEQRQIISRLRAGAIDIVIGTHRLLSQDVAFARLGLLVIDEEHRFGVRHKERIKEMKKNIDVLSMTATPIPRTLSMSLNGLRDISVISTPPLERKAVETAVIPFDLERIREAIAFEFERGGQVYVVTDRIQSIPGLLKVLNRLFPDEQVAVAHGRMDRQQLEQVMLDFMAARRRLLLSTTIIESGIDIPSVNTMIIHRADRFGLAQLYQLRGRIGRADRRAYAYLVVPGRRQLPVKARKRIAVILNHQRLGSGLKVALKDMEIRGSGNILGYEQSGTVNAVGYELYRRLMEEAIAEIKGSRRPEPPEPEIRVPLPAFLPEGYIQHEKIRLEFYQRLGGCRTGQELAGLSAELRDRFGLHPPETQCLLSMVEAKIALRRTGAVRLDVRGETASIRFAPDSPPPADRLVAFIAEMQDAGARLTPAGELSFSVGAWRRESLWSGLLFFLNRLASRIE